MDKENYCNVGRKECVRTDKMSCGGCMTAIAGCTDALRRIVGKNHPWRNMIPVSTLTSQTLTLYDPNGNRIASATVQRGNLITADYR